MKKVMFVVQSVLFLMMLSGCWITEKGHVKSLFKDYWKAYDPKSKLTGIYVYETKKPHVFDVEYTYSWAALRGSGTTDRVATDRVIVAFGLEGTTPTALRQRSVGVA